MSKKLCPKGHAFVTRLDPDTTGYLAMCDTCGWSAPYVVARESAEFQPEDGVPGVALGDRLASAQEQEAGQRQLQAGKRRGD